MEKSNVREFTCEWCKSVVRQVARRKSLIPSKKPRRFCSKSCSNKSRHASGNLRSRGDSNPMHGRTIYEAWVQKFGEEEANRRLVAYKEKCKISNTGDSNGMFGKNHTETSRSKMSNAVLGKSLEQRWGQEKAEQYKNRLRLTMSGAGNPMYGKTSSGGRSVKGTYKGLFFRSLMEYSFMKHLEGLGLDLATDVEYETIRVPLDEGHTYCTDFYVPSHKKVYEVKPSKVALSELNQRKFDAARKHLTALGLEFSVVTENDFKKIPFSEANQDNDLVFDERTFTYFQKKSQ